MTDEEFEEYFNSIVNTDEFQKIDKFLNISQLPGRTMLIKLRTYLREQHKVGSTAFQEYQRFYDFFEAYKKKECEIYLDKDGYLDLSRILHFNQPFDFAEHWGWFTSGCCIFSDGNVYVCKVPLYYNKSFSKIDDKNCIYNPVIATGIAKELGIDTSENIIGSVAEGEPRILSKYFLKPNEELITFFEYNDGKISEIFGALEQSLVLRKFPKDQIKKAKFDFLKQEFLAKLIGLCDQSEDNTTLIISESDSGRKSVRLSPMYDYDYSFHIAEHIEFGIRKADNGKTDIASFVEQYRDYPEFLAFVENSVSSLNMDSVYKNIYKETGIKFFEKPEKNLVLKDGYTKFVNRNLNTVKSLLKTFEKDEMEEK